MGNTVRTIGEGAEEEFIRHAAKGYIQIRDFELNGGFDNKNHKFNDYWPVDDIPISVTIPINE